MINARSPLFEHVEESAELRLYSPTAMPKAGGFLWNQHMMIQITCRGFAVAQHMQPEPAKYSHGPALEAKTFMQPEHHYYACHPGRFFYVKDEKDTLFSLPYEPVRKSPDSFVFSHHQDSLQWQIQEDDIDYQLTLELADDAPAEQWALTVNNTSMRTRYLTLYPCFSIGAMSWMNQSANFDYELNAIIASSVTPYQKTQDYFKMRDLKDLTYFCSDRTPDSWLSSQALFEGEGGLRNPDALMQDALPNLPAHYAQPAGIMQYRLILPPGKSESFRWLFGPAKDRDEVANLKSRFLSRTTTNQGAVTQFAEQSEGIQIECPDQGFQQFVNHWLPRQVRYHGQSNRLTTDPQTRNFLQDNLGLLFIDPKRAREGFLLALSQQSESGAMPDGILLHPDAELKYINQVPHSDHNLWLTLFLSAYLRETHDQAILNQQVPYSEGGSGTVFEHMEKAMQHLLTNLDKRNLSLIKEGDWCDPMNMVGYKGHGVSAWLSMATCYASRLWSDICQQFGQTDLSAFWSEQISRLTQAINQYFWDGRWYARGITDDGRLFGCQADHQGRIFLNPQTWALLCGVADGTKIASMLKEVDEQLETPYGTMLLAPSYTAMQEDIGRLTQKFPGTAENGSVYNHACAYYAYGLYQSGHHERAFVALKKMLPTEADATVRGQLPVFIPNYYRGAYYQFPDSVGRSSQLFNTGTVAWYYMCVVEELFGLKGDQTDLVIEPRLPAAWPSARIVRPFRGATVEVCIQRKEGLCDAVTEFEGQPLQNHRLSNVQAGQHYKVTVTLPMEVQAMDRIA